MTAKTLIRILITAILVGILFGGRFIREKKHVYLENLTWIQKEILLAVGISMVLIQLIIILNLLKTYYTKSEKSLVKDLLEKTLFKQLNGLIKFIIEAPKILYEEYSDKYDLLTDQIEMTGSYLAVYFNYKRTLLWIFAYIPRIFTIATFFVCTFILKDLYYFYISLFLLLIPLCFRGYLYMVFYQGKLMYEYSEFFLDIKPLAEGVSMTLKTTPCRDKTLEWMTKHYDYLCNSWIIGTRLNNFIGSCYYLDEKFNPLITSFTAVTYLVCWLYILIFYIFF
jgi:hypothetical protein